MSDSLRLRTWCSIVLAFLSAATLHADLKPEEIYQRALPSVMTLEVENARGERFVGSGFLALAEGVAITAWHVVSDARSVWATFADGQRIRVLGCIDRDEQRDLALIKLEPGGKRTSAVLGSAPPLIGTRVYVIGSPRGFDFSITDGLISQIRPIDGFRHYQISCPISPGNSGGPVLNSRGEVIGITSWRRPDAQSLSFAIPSAEAARLDVSRPLIPWDRLAPTESAPAELGLVKSSSTRGSASGERPSEGFRDFQNFLDQSAGKRITVVVEDGKRENRFQFVVPRSDPR